MASCQRLQYGVQDAVQILTKIFCKKPQNKIAVLLQETILSAVSSVRFGVGKMLFSVQFYERGADRWLTKSTSISLWPSNAIGTQMFNWN